MNVYASSADQEICHLVPTPLETDVAVSQLKATLLQGIRRSAFVYRVDCGGCNGCEIEIFASITSLFDAERFGIKVVPSPRHADILLFTGAMTRAMRVPALRAYHGAPDPKICISYGACGCGGGIFHDMYCVWGGSDKIFPIDVYIPGCPPTPPATIYGMAVALGLLEQKLHARMHHEEPGEKAFLMLRDIPADIRVPVEREARLLAGYKQGREISDRFFLCLKSGNPVEMEAALHTWTDTANDPRLTEIVWRLKDLFVRLLQGANACPTA